MKPDRIKRLWELARRAEREEPGAPVLPNATRIAARWAASRTTDIWIVWERTCTVSCVIALAICGATALMATNAPSAAEQDLMLQLFMAQPVSAASTDLPF
ncbi:MAG: hypothetical protein RL088_786 [Verrucomicrobiota bacterium]|jgi:hypothetical protein